MADNYQQFSEILFIDNARQRAWLELVLAAHVMTDAQEQTLRDAGIRLAAIDRESWPGFEWKFDPNDSGRRDLWLYAEDYGNVSHVAEFIRAFLARFRPDDCWQLAWSETCSKLHVGEFGGGGLFVTARSVCILRAADWVQRRRGSFQRRKARASPR
jgi:hypothetical protein